MTNAPDASTVAVAAYADASAVTSTIRPTRTTMSRPGVVVPCWTSTTVAPLITRSAGWRGALQALAKTTRTATAGGRIGTHNRSTPPARGRDHQMHQKITK